MTLLFSLVIDIGSEILQSFVPVLALWSSR
jgi:hypothetical protein